MWPQRVVLWNAGILEVFVSVAHADALHDRPGPRVQHGRERHDLGEPEPLETDPQRRARPFRGVTLAPIWACQAPADLYARRERYHALGYGQADETDKHTRRPHLEGPIAPPALRKLRLPRVDTRVARFA